MNLSSKFEIVNVSDVGRRRPHNEDSTLSDADSGLVILADGMGGYKAGEVASAIAVTSVHKEILAGLAQIEQENHQGPAALTPQSELVKDAVISAKIYFTIIDILMENILKNQIKISRCNLKI